VTSGIVSGLHRSNIGIEEFENFIQTDAAIYPGNSGGALVSLQGDLVGINTAFIGATSSNPGMSFAIPVNMARTVADQIMEGGEIRHGSLGITVNRIPTPPRSVSIPVYFSRYALTIELGIAMDSTDVSDLRAETHRKACSRASSPTPQKTSNG
jgi:hypothetical protein